jgi:hypothetical protein
MRVAPLVFIVVLATGSITHSENSKGSMILAEGFAIANAYSGPLPDFFESWCADTEDGSQCIPTVTLDVFDATKLKRLGAVHAWGKEFRSTASGTLQFKEFILYDCRRARSIR